MKEGVEAPPFLAIVTGVRLILLLNFVGTLLAQSACTKRLQSLSENFYRIYCSVQIAKFKDAS